MKRFYHAFCLGGLLLTGRVELQAQPGPAGPISLPSASTPLSAAETIAFMRRLVKTAMPLDLHKGRLEEFARFGLALVQAGRGTGDEYYKSILIREILPFYLKRLQPPGGNPGSGNPASSPLLTQPQAREIALLLGETWHWLRASSNPPDQELRGELERAIRLLHQVAPGPVMDEVAATIENKRNPSPAVPDAAEAGPWPPHTAYYQQLYLQEPGQRLSLPASLDELHFTYHSALARYGTNLPRFLAFLVIYEAFTTPILVGYYNDNTNGAPRLSPSGRLGPQILVASGWALDLLNRFPDIYEERPDRTKYREQAVFMGDLPGGGALEESAFFRIPLGPLEVGFTSTRRHLGVYALLRGEEGSFRLYERPDAEGNFTEVILNTNQSITLRTSQGRTLRVESVKWEKAKQAVRVTFQIPYAIVSGQEPWLTGVEHGRYSVQSGDTTQNLYLASEEEVVRRWLEHELGGGLRAWDTFLREKGFIPAARSSDTPRDQVSDLSATASLLSAAVQWLHHHPN